MPISKADTKQNHGGPFKKGDARINRGGRPRKEFSITNALREIGEADDAAKIKQLAETMWGTALACELYSAREILNRLEGKSPETLTVKDERIVVTNHPTMIDDAN